MIDKQIDRVGNDKTTRFLPLFPETKVCHIMYLIIQGLHHIHVNGVVHCDLKPQNCMIDKKMQVRIIDFGLSKME